MDNSKSGRVDLLRQFWLSTSALKSYMSITDRVVVSGTNFTTLVIVEWACGLEGLGMFILPWTLLLAFNVIQEGLILSPFTVFVGRFKNDDEQRRYAGVAFIQMLMISGLALVGLLVTAVILTLASESRSLVGTWWMLLLAAPAVVSREFVRRYLFTRLRAISVLVLDCLVSGIQISLLGSLWLIGSLSPGTALISIALATGLPTVAWLVFQRSQFDFSNLSLANELRRHWQFGRWICAGQLSDLAVTHGIAWLIYVMLGDEKTGLFAACNSIVMVINPLLLGIGSILLPRAAQAHHQSGPHEVNRIVWKTTTILALAVGAICLSVAVSGEFLIGLIYSFDSLADVRELVILLALANFISASSFAVDNGLLVVNRPDINFSASVVGLVVTIIAATGLTIQFGIVGAAGGVLIGTLLNSLFQIVAFVRLVGRPTALVRKGE